MANKKIIIIYFIFLLTKYYCCAILVKQLSLQYLRGKNMFEKNLNISVLLDFYGEILTQRQRDMLDMYYNNDLSLAEIAENFSISRQGVRSVLKKGEIILTEMEEKLNLASRFSTVQEKSEEIASRLSVLNSKINDSFVSNEIDLIINQIKELADYTD